MSHVDATARALELLARQRELQRFNKIDTYLPAEGQHRRELYKKQLEFFAAGATYRERAFIAANRVGKTQAGAFEVTLHATGNYPDWWTGRRFDHPVMAWAAGDTSKTARDIIQHALYGPFHEPGTGMIPRDKIVRVTTKTGIADCLETIYVKHVSGGISEIGIQSYDQGRDAFQGVNRQIIWVDEEGPYDIYVECLLRTMVVKGLLMMTATPLLGMSEVMRSFIQPAEGDHSKFYVQATCGTMFRTSTMPIRRIYSHLYRRTSAKRSKGIPQLGAGAIYQVPESDVVVQPFAIPDHWPRAFGLDVGWRKSAAVWGALDRESGVIYLYNEYYRGQAEPSVHAQGIQAPGTWIPGVIDPAAQGRSQVDGQQLITMYRQLGLDLQPAVNAVESGLYQCWQLMSSGKLKVFASLGNWLSEFRMYQRNERGEIVKERDHLMDAMRYLIVSGMRRATVKPASTKEFDERMRMQRLSYGGSAWMM